MGIANFYIPPENMFNNLMILILNIGAISIILSQITNHKSWWFVTTFFVTTEQNCENITSIYNHSAIYMCIFNLMRKKYCQFTNHINKTKIFYPFKLGMNQRLSHKHMRYGKKMLHSCSAILILWLEQHWGRQWYGTILG